ncbi:OmpA family protein [Dyadobacter diqingensis]|uniref:OmpA family protein n=1 Tax=Dyadobacter diqingensis TaxID=2938121 RepID=UPI0020C4FBD8|nr:OmpA family protein [Dyadobacter diqingensis]
MKPVIICVAIHLMFCFSGFCQDLSGVWSGIVEQPGNEFGPFTLDVRINQVGKLLSGEIKTGSRYGFVVQKFRGLIYDGKVLMNEFEVIKDSSNAGIAWCLKDLKGFFFVERNEKKRIIEGPWTSKKSYQKKAYLAGNCPPGTFKISQTITSSKEANKTPSAVRGNSGKSATKMQMTQREPDPVQVDYVSASAQNPNDSRAVEKRVSDGETAAFPKPKVGEKLTLSVRFEQSKAVILPESKPELDRLLEYLQAYPTMEIALLGHTDNQGDPARNLALSFDRVNVIKRYLVDHRISTNRISVKGLGSKTPVAVNNSEENRRLNRRVEMIVTRQ